MPRDTLSALDQSTVSFGHASSSVDLGDSTRGDSVGSFLFTRNRMSTLLAALVSVPSYPLLDMDSHKGTLIRHEKIKYSAIEAEFCGYNLATRTARTGLCEIAQESTD